MNKAICLMRALEFIETRLSEPLTLDDVARASLMSLPHLHRVFSNAFRCSLKEYIVKRRLCAAAKAMVERGASVTDCAWMCQYQSVESFTRAFKKQFLITPSAFRKTRRFTELYPMLIINDAEEANYMTQINRYDVSELAGKILAAKCTYMLDVDIDGMDVINKKLGMDAGDAVIAATASRIDRALPGDASFFRIGGDQFIVLTMSGDAYNAASIADTILSFADEAVPYGDKETTFTVSVGIYKVPEDLNNAQEAVEGADQALVAAKRAGKNRRAGV